MPHLHSLVVCHVKQQCVFRDAIILTIYQIVINCTFFAKDSMEMNALSVIPVIHV